MAIVYQHLRKDTNEVFYIGIGKTSKRAYSKHNRNKYWNNIINYTDYDVKILFQDVSWEMACVLETQLISEYGRKDNNTGILCNMTNGGEGCINLSEETINKIRLSKIGTKHSKETINKIVKKTRKPVLKYTKEGEFLQEFNSMTEAAEEMKSSISVISNSCKNKIRSYKGFIWKYKEVK